MSTQIGPSPVLLSPIIGVSPQMRRNQYMRAYGAEGQGISEIKSSPYYIAYSLLSTAGVVTGAYHGYKRNNSVGWAIGWALLGGLFPFITIPVSVAQGFGKPAK